MILDILKELWKQLEKYGAKGVDVIVSLEGPVIAIYTNNLGFFMEHDEIIRTIAKSLKKRFVVRAMESARMPEKMAREVIKKLLPPEAGVTDNDIIFDHATGEVIIVAKNVGVIVGKGGKLLKEIASKTNWRPRVVRAPLIPSKTITVVRSMLYSMCDRRKEFLSNLANRIHRPIVFPDKHVKITVLGAGREVGRSAILVETKESKVLLDFGIKPGTPEAYPALDAIDLYLDELDAVIVTHAHLDHVGLVPYLYKYGYSGPVYMTEPTLYLSVLLLRDYLEVVRREGRDPLFHNRDIQDMIAHTITLSYEEVTDVAPDIKLTFFNAAHVLGSAMAHLHIGSGFCNVLYTGDFKFGITRLFDKPPHEFQRVEILIMETTYGGKDDIMPKRAETEKMFIDIVKRTFDRGGKVLVPVLAVGRAQDIMLVLYDAINAGLLPKDTRVYIEGMIVEATAIHTAFPEYLRKDVRHLILSEKSPFKLISEESELDKLKEVIKEPKRHQTNFIKVDSAEKREEAILEPGPTVILATSGMLTGGPVLTYLERLAEDPRNSLVFVSYQVEGTLGRKILDGLREIVVTKDKGEYRRIKINMEVYKVDGFSGHSDRRQLAAFLKNLKPRPEKVVLVHGERRKVHEFAVYTEVNLRLPTITPEILDSIRVR